MNEQHYFLPHTQLQTLLDALQQAGYACVGPLVRDGAIVYDVLTDSQQLPWGIRDYQAPGEYRLEAGDKNRAFAFANGPQAIKPLLFKPSETVWRVERDSVGKLAFKACPMLEQPVAILGARACDIVAMTIQDKVFLAGEHTDNRYRARREALFVVAVNCSYSSGNCFCVSAGTGPAVRSDYDLLMAELDDGFVVQFGSARGQALLAGLQLSPASAKQCQDGAQQTLQAAQMQTKQIPLSNQSGLRDLLFSNLGHPRWEAVAERCLSCGNCTSVCPTCFCHSEADKPDLDGTSSTHQKEWDSCFTAGHSFVAGKPLRDTTEKRYRQWLTHKVGSWFDQFGTSGCVGCGRCVTWCPVGIDLTEELAAIAGETS